MPRLTLSLDPATAERLRELARAERRTPRDQAGLILEQALEPASVRPAPPAEGVADDRS